jgi:hypothetical protein
MEMITFFKVSRIFSVTKCLVSIFLWLQSWSIVNAQTDTTEQAIPTYNTKKNFVMMSASVGGGDYPFAGLGLSINRQFFNGNTIAGISFQYIGNTVQGNWTGINDIQMFPIMLDIRQRFMESPNGQFTTFLIISGGYVVMDPGSDSDVDGNPFDYKNGWAINPGIGFRFNIFKNTGLMIDLTWLHHDSPREWQAPVSYSDRKHWDVGLVRGSIFF